MSRLPVEFMAAVLGITATARIADIAIRNRTRRALTVLAANWRMQYVSVDRFGLQARVADHFPVPGAADMVVCDVIYGTEGDYYRYYFTAIYTRGVVRTKSRIVQAATCREPRENHTPRPLLDLEISPRRITLKEEYILLRQGVMDRVSTATSS